MRLLKRRPLKYAWIRSAGMLGINAFEEIFQTDDVLMCCELYAPSAEEDEDVVDVTTCATKNTPASNSHSRLLTSSGDSSGTSYGGGSYIHVPVVLDNVDCEDYGTRIYSLRVAAILEAIQNSLLDGRTKGRDMSYLKAKKITITTTNGVFRDVSKFVSKYCPHDLTMRYSEFGYSSGGGGGGSAVAAGQEQPVDMYTVPDNFLRLSTFTTVKLDGLVNVTTICDAFMTGCPNLTSVDLSPLRSVQSVGVGFLIGCVKLVSVNLSALHRLTTIPVGFLRGCTSLKDVNFTALINVEHIKSGFLDSSCCVDPVHINLSSMMKLKTIGEHFMSYSVAISKVTFPAVHLQQHNVPRRFLLLCRSLKEVDLSMFANVSSIDESFLEACIELESINLSPLSNVVSIKEKFMSNCNTVPSVDLTPLRQVTILPNNFMMGCSSISTLDMSAFQNVQEVGFGFLSGCRRLKTLHLWEAVDPTTTTAHPTTTNIQSIRDDSVASQSLLSTIGHSAFTDCVALEHLDTRVFCNLTTIPNAFAMNCSSLTHIDLSPLRSVRVIGRQFLYGCSGLTSLDLSPLGAISIIPAFFLGKCTNLQYLDLSQLLSVSSVDNEGFLMKARPTDIQLPPPPSSKSLEAAITSHQMMIHHHHPGT